MVQSDRGFFGSRLSQDDGLISGGSACPDADLRRGADSVERDVAEEATAMGGLLACDGVVGAVIVGSILVAAFASVSQRDKLAECSKGACCQSADCPGERMADSPAMV